MVDKPISPEPDDQDSWENLAKDLFGVEFDSPPVPSDDLDDELLNDDFLKDEQEPEASAEAGEEDEPAVPEEPPAEVAQDEPATVTSSASEEAEPAESVAKQPPGDDLDALLDFSQPYRDEDEYEAAEEAESAQEESAEAEAGPDLFQKLAAESDETEEEEAVEFAESVEDELENEDESEEQLDDTDDFWDVLEKFAPEELGTPHIDHGQPRGGKPPRDPEIGMISEAPKNEAGESSRFETEFDTDSDFGLGVLEDVETDEDDETEDIESAGGSEAAETGEDPEARKKPKRRRRRRRRGGRRKTPAAPDTEESDADTGEEPFDEEELSEEEQDVETETSRPTDSSRYKNIPTWSEAIDLIVDRKPKASSESRGRRGNRTESKNRKRGGRRRRSRKSSS